MNDLDSTLSAFTPEENTPPENGSNGDSAALAEAAVPASNPDLALDVTMGDMETDLPPAAPAPATETVAAATDALGAPLAGESDDLSSVALEPELMVPEESSAEESAAPSAAETAQAEADLPVASAPVSDEEIEIPWGELDLTGGPAEEPETAPALTAEGETATTPPAEPSAVTEEPLPIRRVWYVVHCYSGYENKVKKGLEQRINSMSLQDYIFRVVVPVEREVEIREGQRKNIERRVFPGYILVEMMELVDRDLMPAEPTQALLNLAIKSDEVWYAVRNTPGVTGFVSSGEQQRPVPLREEEVQKILKRMESEEPKVHVTFRVGQSVHIIDGPFADFRGNVDAVDMTKGKVRVLVSFFGRETPVELDLLQVEKV